jgi:hypothetical protein
MGRCFGHLHAAATIETKLEVFLYPWPAGNGVSSLNCAVR